MQTGHQVVHRQRPELGIGTIQVLGPDGSCNVQFATARFSRIHVSQLAPAPEGAVANGGKSAMAVAGLGPQEQLHNAMARYGIPALWHITSRDNVAGIFRHGLLSRHLVHQRGLSVTDISDRDVQERRANRWNSLPHVLHDYVPLYLRARNPMLFCRRHLNPTLCLVAVHPEVMLDNEFAISDGNAASLGTRFYDRLSDLRFLDWEALNQEYWNSVLDGKRKRCAEVLVYPQVAPRYIMGVHTATLQSCQLLQAEGISTQHSRHLFF